MPHAKHLTYMSHVYPMAIQAERHWNCLHLTTEEPRLRAGTKPLSSSPAKHTHEVGWLFKADLLDSTKEATYPSPPPHLTPYPTGNIPEKEEQPGGASS